MDPTIHPGGEDLPHGFVQSGSGLILPGDLAREKHTVTEEEGKILDMATRIANRYGWFMNFGCPHEACRQQPLVEGVAIPGGQLLRCQHQEVTVMRPLPGKPNAAIQRRRQSLQAKLEERAIVPIAKRMNAEQDAMPADAAQTGQVDGKTT